MLRFFYPISGFLGLGCFLTLWVCLYICFLSPASNLLIRVFWLTDCWLSLFFFFHRVKTLSATRVLLSIAEVKEKKKQTYPWFLFCSLSSYPRHQQVRLSLPLKYILNLSPYPPPTLVHWYPFRISFNWTHAEGLSLVSQLIFSPTFETFSIQRPEWSLRIWSDHVIPCLTPSSGFPWHLR